MQSPSPTVVDLFCGAGGLSEGFRQAGFEILLGVDSDPICVKTYRKNFGRAMKCKIENLTAAKIRKKIEGKPITVLAAGPPCQAFSTVAVAKLKSLGKSTTRLHPLNRLYREFLRLVKDIQPPFFVMENVSRMFTMSNGAIKEEIKKELGNIYKIDFYYENVASFGVPQFRKRRLVIGNKVGLQNPLLEHSHHDPRSVNASNGENPYENVRNAISDLPRIKAGGGSDIVPYPQRKKELTSYQIERRKDSSSVFYHVARKHSKRDLKIFRLLRPSQRIDDLPKKLNPYRTDIFKDKYKKQPWSRPSSTILAHLSKDGLMFIHPDRRQNRSLTPREAARLQSFNDTFFFQAPNTHRFIQIGNAVPPLFARAIGSSIMESMTIKVPASARRSSRSHK